jgi:hypothetical protein
MEGRIPAKNLHDFRLEDPKESHLNTRKRISEGYQQVNVKIKSLETQTQPVEALSNASMISNIQFNYKEKAGGQRLYTGTTRLPYNYYFLI